MFVDIVALTVNALKICFVVFALLFVAIGLIRLATKVRLSNLRKNVITEVGSAASTKNGKQRRPRIIGFFHPFCDAMGGGEKVLYQAIKAIQ